MHKLLSRSAAILALGGVALAAAAPADARWRGGRGGGYYGGYYGRPYYRNYHGGGRGAAVLGAGIIGLAAGAALASRPRYYDYGADYYAPPPPPPRYYYAEPYCRADWRWDGWARQYVRVTYCD